MIFKKKILVFPCGSEIGLEIHRSLNSIPNIELIGGSSLDDHGKFVYNNYIGCFPFIDNPDFLPFLKDIISQYKIDAIYPAMDSVISHLKSFETYLDCKIISSCLETVQICSSKKATYNFFSKIVNVPKIYSIHQKSFEFPVFLKPDVGYGSRGVLKANNLEAINVHMENFPNCLVLEYLPGAEYTVDCISDKNGILLFIGPRERKRISNGISVNSSSVLDNGEFISFANNISKYLKFNGAWFFQVKRNIAGELVLLEIASRFGGSSSVNRARGVNFSLLSIYISFGLDVKISPNTYEVEVSRSFDVLFSVNLFFDTLYIDLDDTIICGNIVNPDIMKFLFKCLNFNKRIILITRHRFNLNDTLIKYRLKDLFDEIIHLKDGQKKSEYIGNESSIFIDDSFSERQDVMINKNIPVLSPDIVSNLNIKK
jgi:hypothetical protein